MTEPTHYLNVDLDLWARFDLQPLVDALARDTTVMNVGPRPGGQHFASLEVARRTTTADATIRAFAKLIAKLPRRARFDWNRARLRSFNIGIQAGSEPYAFELHLAPETITTAAALDARITITVYRPHTG